MQNIHTLLKLAQLRWTGHVTRMPDERLPKKILYGELQVGKCSHGGQKKRYKDTLKASLKDINIPTELWEQIAQDRTKWRGLIKRGAGEYEAKRISEAEQKHAQRKGRAKASPTELCSSDLSCSICNRQFRAKIGLISHLRKKVREKSRECHNHKPQPFPDPKRKRKPTNPNKHKPNKRTKSTKISSLFPKRGNRNTKRTEKHKNKMTHGKTYNKSPRRINHKATKSKTNTGTTALERSVEQTTGGFKALLQLANFTQGPNATLNTEIHKNSVRTNNNTTHS